MDQRRFDMHKKNYKCYLLKQIVSTICHYFPEVKHDKTNDLTYNDILEYFGSRVQKDITADDCRNASGFEYKTHNMFSVSDIEINSAFRMYSFIKYNKITELTEYDPSTNKMICISNCVANYTTNAETANDQPYAEVEIQYVEEPDGIIDQIISPKPELMTADEENNNVAYWWIFATRYVEYMTELA